MKSKQINIALASGLVLIAVASRIVNAEMGIYNLAPVAAIGLFAGAVLKDRRLAFLLTIMAQFISDVYIQLFTSMDGFYGISQFFNYGAMMLVTLLGTQMGKPKALKVAGFAVAGSVIYFLMSNLGVFLQGWYGYTVQGFVDTYVLAVPFYRNTLIGDVVFSGVLFGTYYFVNRFLTAKLTKA